MARMNWDRVHQEKRALTQAKPKRKRKPDKAIPVILSGDAAKRAFGTCPSCRESWWYDNRPAIKSGRYKANAPIAKCKKCGYAMWQDGYRVAKAKNHRLDSSRQDGTGIAGQPVDPDGRKEVRLPTDTTPKHPAL